MLVHQVMFVGLHMPNSILQLGGLNGISWMQDRDLISLTCLSLKVDVGEVEFQYSEDLGSKRLNAVVNVGRRPLQTYYSLSPQLKEMAQKMHSCKDSLIFQQLWEEAAQKAGEEYESSEEEDEDDDEPVLDLDEVFYSLISPCFESYEMLYDDLRSGSLTLSAVDTIFQEFTNHPEEIKTELNALCELRPGEDRNWVDQRSRQIQQYHEMHLAFDAAKVIANVKESLNLSGDFSVLENLLDIVSIHFFSSLLSGCWLESLDKSEPSCKSIPVCQEPFLVPKCLLEVKIKYSNKVLLCDLSSKREDGTPCFGVWLCRGLSFPCWRMGCISHFQTECLFALLAL